MPFVRIHFLGSCWKILISFSTLIIHQAYCMWFKDAHFTKAPTTPKCYPITDKIFWLLSVEHHRRSRGWATAASEIIHWYCSPPHFSVDTFCSANLLLNSASSLYIRSTLLVCFVYLWHFLHPARSSTAASSGSWFPISFCLGPPWSDTNPLTGVCTAQTWCLQIASCLAVLQGKGPVTTLLGSSSSEQPAFPLNCMCLHKRRGCMEDSLAGIGWELDQTLICFKIFDYFCPRARNL